MLMGDWNCVTKEVDVEKNYDQKKSDALANLEETFNLDDAYRSLHPLASAADFTFYRPSVSRSRLDRAYLSPKVRSELESMSHEPGLGDHAILVVSLAAPAPDPPTYSRMAVSRCLYGRETVTLRSTTARVRACGCATCGMCAWS